MGIPDLGKIEFQSPSDYMRTKYPELFSDTNTVSEPSLTSSLLEYHLNSLTSRKQELEFETFITKLLELEICPNIKPQTGPVGGGDDGYDASTHPVAPVLSKRVWWGNPNPPTEEKWAFAISCKKKWAEKITSDIKKISELDEGFTKVFFITNQFARAKIRGKKEQDLGKKYGFEVQILDRTWIVSKVLEHNHEDMTIELLDLKVDKSERIEYGPMDSSRIMELKALEKKLAAPLLYYGNDFLLARDYFKAATLSRGLGQPRATIEGLFTRSRQIAGTVALPSQVIHYGYEHAWTSFWWFEDYQALNRIYGEIERYLDQTDDAYDCENLLNLWILLMSMVRRGEISPQSADLSNRLTAIKKWLSTNSEDETRPNNALYSTLLNRIIELLESIENKDKVNSIFMTITKDLKNSKGLVIFPFMKIINRFIKLGQIFSNYEGYDMLFQTLEELSVERTSDIQRGEINYIRGIQCLENDQIESALRYLGQARVRLMGEDTLEKCLHASFGCSLAYLGLGHHWASKMEALVTVYLNSRRQQDGTILNPLVQFFAVKLICWEELRLGQIRAFSKWYQYNLSLLNYLEQNGFDIEKYQEELVIQDGVLGCFLLNIAEEEISQLDQLQTYLESNGLIIGELCLKYRKEGIDGVKNDFSEEMKTEEIITNYFETLRDNPASGQVPIGLTDEFKEYRKWEVKIMGVTYCFTIRNELSTILLSENLLAVIEAALCLAKWENFAFILDEVNIIIDSDASGSNPPIDLISSEPDPDGYFVTWGSHLIEYLKKSPEEIREFYSQFLFKILLDSTIDPMSDLKEEFDRLHSEDTFSRALGLTPTGIINLAILGEKYYDI